MLVYIRQLTIILRENVNLFYFIVKNFINNRLLLYLFIQILVHTTI